MWSTKLSWPRCLTWVSVNRKWCIKTSLVSDSLLIMAWSRDVRVGVLPAVWLWVCSSTCRLLQPPHHRPRPLQLADRTPEVLKPYFPPLKFNLSKFSSKLRVSFLSLPTQNSFFHQPHCPSFVFPFSLCSRSLTGLTGEIFLQICSCLQCVGMSSCWLSANFCRPCPCVGHPVGFPQLKCSLWWSLGTCSQPSLGKACGFHFRPYGSKIFTNNPLQEVVYFSVGTNGCCCATSPRWAPLSYMTQQDHNLTLAPVWYPMQDFYSVEQGEAEEGCSRRGTQEKPPWVCAEGWCSCSELCLTAGKRLRHW